MVKDIYLTEYFLDESIDVLFIDFDGVSAGEYGEVFLPEGAQSTLFVKGTMDNAHYCEVVAPENFMSSPLTDNIEVNGVNLKELVNNYFTRKIESAPNHR